MAEEVDIKASFGVVKSEKRYLSDRVDVMDQRRKVLEANNRITLTKRALDRLNTDDPSYQATLSSYKKAVNDLDAAKTELNRVEASARSDYRKAYKKETGFVSERAKARAETAEKKNETLDQQISILQNQLQRAEDTGQNTVAIRAELEDKIAQRNQTGKYAPTPTPGKEEGGPQASQDVNALLASAPGYLFNLKDKSRRVIAQSLKDAGYNVPVTGIYNDVLKEAYIQAILDNNARNTDTKRNQTLDLFLIEKARETSELQGAAGAGGDGGLSPGTVSISTPNEAAGLIVQAFKANGFDVAPSPEQIKSISARLNKEEKKFSSVVRPVRRVQNGKEYIEYVGGLDRTQFLNEIIQALPEYDQRKQAAKALTKQDLAKTARANGLDLDKDFGDTVNTWVKRVESGEDIDVIKGLIRNAASLGMPDKIAAMMNDNAMDLESIYAPYKRIMASTLELTPDSISLNDPTLRTAVGPEKEMTIYDFERNLRQDNRWQYTNKAREEVADATLKVLRDFGFVG